MEATVYDVVLEDERWRVTQGMSTIGPFRSKADAIEFARKFARADPPGRVVVHEPDGTVLEEDWPASGAGGPLSQ